MSQLESSSAIQLEEKKFKYKIVDIPSSSDAEDEEDYIINEAENLKDEPKLSFRDRVKEILIENRISIVASIIVAILIIILQATSWQDLKWGAWYTIWVTAITMGLLVHGSVEPEVALWLNTCLLLAAEIIDVKQAFSAFSNDAIVTIGLMVVVVTSLETTGAVTYLSRFVMGQDKNIMKTQARMMVIVTTASAFMNNTPLVALMVPVVESWCRKFNLPASKFMIPLSYSAILGGLCTIIGTSTNLIVQGMMKEKFPKDERMRMTFFEIGAVGVPMAIAGVVYVAVFSRWLLPIRQTPALDIVENQRNYLATVRVLDDGPAVGKTIEEAGLRHLRKLFLVEIQRRDGGVIAAPPSHTLIEAQDRLCFAGEVEAVKELWRMQGFGPDTGGLVASKGRHAADRRVLVEAILSRYADCIGKTVRASRFQRHYSAAIIAVHRLGDHVGGGIGSIVLQGGDHLLLDSSEAAFSRLKKNSDFALVMLVDTDEQSSPKPKKYTVRLVLATVFLLALIATNTADQVPLATSALVCIFLLLSTGIMTPKQVQKAIPGSLLLAVTGAFGVAKGLETTGVAKKLANAVVGGFGGHGIGSMFAIYLSTVFLTAVLSNGASVALTFPVAMNIAASGGINMKAFAYTIALAASADFSTPIGYQTNLMVSGPGGYQFLDYTKFGVPLQLLCMIISVPLCYQYWA